MLIVALVMAVIGLAALVTAVVPSNELVAWVCIGASALGVALLVVDAVRERKDRRLEGLAAQADDTEESDPPFIADAENTEMRRGVFGAEDAARQQTPEFVANIIAQIADGKISVLSGGHIIIRHSKITGVFPPPAA